MIFGIVGNTQKKALNEILPRLFQWLFDQDIPFVLDEAIYYALHLDLPRVQIAVPKEIIRQVDIILAFGGDGTILSTARMVGAAGIPILGINLGRLGFLAEIAPGEIIETLIEILAGRYTIVERSLLEARIANHPNTQKIYSLNDVVIDKADLSRMIRVDVHIDDELLNSYRCDGLIVASPTGSTAYSLSAAGPIVEPDVRAIIINPICPHSLSARPVLIADNKEVRVTAFAETGRLILCGDGQTVQHIPSGSNVFIRKADFCVRWVKCRSKGFYEVLRTKLAWGD